MKIGDTVKVNGKMFNGCFGKVLDVLSFGQWPIVVSLIGSERPTSLPCFFNRDELEVVVSEMKQAALA